MSYKLSFGEKFFNVFNVVMLAFVAILALYPFMYTLSMSISSQAEASSGGLHFLPRVMQITKIGSKEDIKDNDIHKKTTEDYQKSLLLYAKLQEKYQKDTAEFAIKGPNEMSKPQAPEMPKEHHPKHLVMGSTRIHYHPEVISFMSYVMVFKNPNMLIGYTNTLFRTVVGTILVLLMTCIAAYPLSRKSMPFRKQLVFFLLFTMLFGGGLIPTFLLIKALGLYNNIWVYIIPGLLGAFNIIIVKNFFQSIPDSYAESAQLDGASDWTILFRIYMPLSKPVLATVALWTAVGHWNSWFDAMIFINDNTKQVLQTFLQRIVIEGSTDLIEKGMVNPDLTQYTSDTVKAATVIVTILPILLVYPFVQKYFVKGIMLGGIKE